jgi:hypothetical protein
MSNKDPPTTSGGTNLQFSDPERGSVPPVPRTAPSSFLQQTPMKINPVKNIPEHILNSVNIDRPPSSIVATIRRKSSRTPNKPTFKRPLTQRSDGSRKYSLDKQKKTTEYRHSMVLNGSILVPNTGSFGLQEASLKLSNLKKS